QPVVPRSKLLLQRGVGQEVACKLLRREAVERQIAVEGIDDIVPVTPERAGIVAVVAHAVRVANQVQPVHGHTLTEMRRGKQPAPLAPVGARRVGGEESSHFLRSRWQAGKVEAYAPQ